MERELALEVVRVTELAALASAPWMGRGDKINADEAPILRHYYEINKVVTG